MKNFKNGKLDEEKVDIPIIRVTVFSLKELRNLCHRYMVASLSSKTRKMLDEKNTTSISQGRQSFPCTKS